MPSTRLIASHSPPLSGKVRLPGDKSISQRALLFSALAAGTSEVEGMSEGEDTLSLAHALQQLGVGVMRKKPHCWHVSGLGIGGLKAPSSPLDCGNSGTAARLLAGVLAGYPFAATLVGDESLSARPMKRIMDPLAAMGAGFQSRKNCLPLVISGCSPLLPCDYRLPHPSAQVKACLIFAALHAAGTSKIEDPFTTRNHSELMLPSFGLTPSITPLAEGGEVIELAGAELTPANLIVPADPSSGAFAAAAAALLPGSSIVLPGLCLNPRRFGFYDALAAMGVEISISRRRKEGGEEIGDVAITAPDKLTAITWPADKAPAMIDEYPALAMVAACAEGTSLFAGLGELRIKESDRLLGLIEGLRANGVLARNGDDDPDSLLVEGQPQAIKGGGVVAASGDHRIAMSFAVLGLAAKQPITIQEADTIATSFPDFVAVMKKLGAHLAKEA